jgi:polyhydroxyalkanoate synthesis regulator phasin
LHHAASKNLKSIALLTVDMGNPRHAAAFMAGVLEAKYENGELSENMKDRINEMLEDADLDNVKIE